MPQIFVNNCVGALSSGITAVDTTMTLVDAALFPAPGADFYLLTLIQLSVETGKESAWEVVRVTSKAGNTLTIERAQEGTTALDWPTLTGVEMRVTAGTLNDLQEVTFSEVTSTPSTLAGYGITDAATSAQGLLADTAVQPGDNISSLANDASYATISEVNIAVAGVVDSAPEALNTLNELSAALGDDPNFATSTATALGNRLRIDTDLQALSAAQKQNALTNLGLGTAATTPSTAYATAAQGALADTAVQPADLGTAAAQDATAFATAAQGVLATTAIQTETDPTVPAHVKSITTTNISNWDAAFAGLGDVEASLNAILGV